MTSSTRQFIRSQKEKQKKRKLTITMILLAIVLIIVAVILIIEIPKTRPSIANEAGMSLGDPNAPVKVIEFSNYNCGHCKNFALNQSADFIKKYVDTGKVYFTSYPYPWNEQDITYNASLASFCAGDQNVYFDFQELVFSSVTNPDDYSNEKLVDYAKRAGADTELFEACMQDPNLAERINDTKALGATYNVQGTPSFIVNGTLVYSDKLNETVDAALEASGE